MKPFFLIQLLLSVTLTGLSQVKSVDSLIQICVILHLTDNIYLMQNISCSTDTAFVLFNDDYVDVGQTTQLKNEAKPTLVYLTRNNAKEMVKKRKTMYLHLVSKEALDSNSYRITICLMHGEILRMRWWQRKKVWFGNTGVCSSFDIINGDIFSFPDNPKSIH